MISKKMSDNVDVAMYSFYSFMSDNEYKKNLKQAIKKISDAVGEKTIYVELVTTHENGNETKQTVDIEKFISDGLEMPKDVKSFKFELIIKCKSRKGEKDPVADIHTESVFKSGVFVPGDYVQEHGKTNKPSDKNKEEVTLIDKEFLQDHCHGRIRFEGVVIKEL